MINYFKSFKEFIPTWIIAVLMFFGIFIWPLIIAVILIIIQTIQKKKIIKKGNDSIQFVEKYTDNECTFENYQEKYIILEKEKNELENKLKYLVSENELLKSKKEKNEFENDKFVLCAGKYKGNDNIPSGIYNIKILSGSGSIITNKPDDLYFRMSSDPKERKDYDWSEKYNNIEISDETILKISDNANIEFSLSKKYDFSKEIKEKEELINKSIFNAKTELEAIKRELSTLNNEVVKKYYKFSNYNDITSQECKNKLILLKEKEHQMRREEKDVSYIVYPKIGKKTTERIIRQMLRTFNSECDNIIHNISLSNIDKCRKDIQKSFETINQLYALDSMAIKSDLLKLKLEQATLMYTYELKYQQEKEIQRAIKEQMIEEAKAEKEIQEKKKKIEKDLQQHTGEINRLLKYMQKTQIDAEKQLYIDKIRELEEKIKDLQEDKTVVLQREANAKAGFVYIISNIGSFGEDIYKIGMTRRLEPMDRVKELSSASVPFEFDVHAMIFSSDAPELENLLHKHFADRAVNKVNPRKEFFNVNIDEIENVVKQKYNETVQFTKIPVATEYRQSLNM